MTEGQLKHRIKNAIVILNECKSFNVGSLTFNCSNNSELSVTGWSLKNDLTNLTENIAITELDEIKALFKKMTLTSPELSTFITERKIIYHLDYDSGKGAVGICTETNGQLKWNTEL